LADRGDHPGRCDPREWLRLDGVAKETALVMTSDDRKPWDARLVEWMQHGSSKARYGRADPLIWIAGGISGGQLADGHWSYAACLFAVAAVYRLYRALTQRT
jgi:hypothetical protein